jgi:tetratricopeptide (TPR) repeat protein
MPGSGCEEGTPPQATTESAPTGTATLPSERSPSGVVSADARSSSVQLRPAPDPEPEPELEVAEPETTHARAHGALRSVARAKASDGSSVTERPLDQATAQAAEAARLTRAAGDHGEITGITYAGIEYAIAEFRRARPDVFEPQPVDGEFVVETASGSAGVAYRNSPNMGDRVAEVRGLDDGMRVSAVSDIGEWIEVEGGRWLPKECLKPVLRRVSTSDIIKASIQPATVPPGWTCVPEVTNAKYRWYTHHYVDDATGKERLKDDGKPDPPPNTYSYCAKLAADPATAQFIGKPTHFLSHAHTMDVLETLNSVERYVSKFAPDVVATMYWWIDGFSIDQHECQYSPPSIDDNSAVWANTFQEAIRKMGNVVMVLNPWNDPLVLSRLWCLWELHCAVATDSKFGICMSLEQEEAFRVALCEDSGDLAMMTLSGVDVNKAEGNEKDKNLIMGGIHASPGGAEMLNKTAVMQLRESFVGESARDWVASLRSTDGSLQSDEAIAAGAAVAGLLGHHLGHWESARVLWEEIADRLDGVDGENALSARSNLASVMVETGQASEARVMKEAVLAKEIEMFGPDDTRVLISQNGLANILNKELQDYEAALELYDAVVAGYTKAFGPNNNTTLAVRHNRATTYRDLRRYSEARSEYEAVLTAESALYGLRHPSVLSTRANLASLLYDNFNEKEEGLRLMREVVTVRNTVLGEQHPDTQTTAQVLMQWERAADPTHVAALVAGAVVVLAENTTEIPAGAIGEVLKVRDDGGRRVRFREATWLLRPGQVNLASPEQTEQWAALKAERDMQVVQWDAVLVVGAVVVLAENTPHAPAGAIGEVVQVKDDGGRRVRFREGTWLQFPDQLTLADPEQTEQWTALKAELDTQEEVKAIAAKAAALAQLVDVHAVCVDGMLRPEYNGVYLSVGVHDGWCRFKNKDAKSLLRSSRWSKWILTEKLTPDGSTRIAFVADCNPGELPVGEHEWKLRVAGKWKTWPVTVALLHTEAEVAEHMELLLADKTAHAAALVVGSCVLWTSSNDDIPKGTFGEIVQIKDNERRRVQFPAGKWTFPAEQLVLASPEQAEQQAAALELDAQAAQHEEREEDVELAAALALSLQGTAAATQSLVPLDVSSTVDELVSWGFDESAVRAALVATGGDKQAAVNMLLG